MLRAIAIYEFKSGEAGELPLLKNEIVDVLEKHDAWWTCKNKYGESGLVPVTYLAAPVTDDDIAVVSRGKALKSHKASSENELTVNEGDQVAVLDDSDEYWWFVGISGQTGYIPGKVLQIFRKRATTTPSNPLEPKKELVKFKLQDVAPNNALCDEEATLLFSFENALPQQGKFLVIFKGSHCEKVVDGIRVNDFTLKTTTPQYYPAETTKITINHQEAGKQQQIILKGKKFTFHSQLDLVHKILSAETEPMKFLCSAYQIEQGAKGNLENVDHILTGNLKKKIPDGVELVKKSRSALVQEQDHPKETPTLLHFAAYYNLKKLAQALLGCPGAKEAMSIKNCHGNGPVGVAQLRKHSEIKEILENVEAIGNEDEEGTDIYESMESCYEIYTKMSPPPRYVLPDAVKPNAGGVPVDPGDEIYEDMEGGQRTGEIVYDRPRGESADHFEPYDGEYDANFNKVDEDSEIQKKIDEYKVFGRMTEKEVQLALLMKRVKERYITQEQALEMAKVLRLEPQSAKSSGGKTEKKPKIKKKVSAPSVDYERKSQSLPRTMSTSSGSSVSSAGSTGSSGSTSDGFSRPTRPVKTLPTCARPFSYLGAPPPVGRTNPVSPPPPTAPRRPDRPAESTPPVPVRRQSRQ